MPSWTTMNNLSTGDLLTEADMDAIRGNIEYLLEPNAGSDYDASASTSSTSWAALSTATVTSNGGRFLLAFCCESIYFNTGGGLYTTSLRINDGTTQTTLYTHLQQNVSYGPAWVIVTDPISAGSTTFTFEGQVSNASGGITVTDARWYVVEI